MSKQTELSKFFQVPKRKTTDAATSKKEYEKKRKRGWVSSWADTFPGLYDTENGNK
jgi:hypothetical protein